RLGVLGEPEIALGSLEHQPGELLRERVVDLLEDEPRHREGFRQLSPHAHRLAALARKHEGPHLLLLVGDPAPPAAVDRNRPADRDSSVGEAVKKAADGQRPIARGDRRPRGFLRACIEDAPVYSPAPWSPGVSLAASPCRAPQEETVRRTRLRAVWRPPRD